MGGEGGGGVGFGMLVLRMSCDLCEHRNRVD